VRPAVGRAGGRLTLANFRVNRGASIARLHVVISTLLIHYDLLHLWLSNLYEKRLAVRIFLERRASNTKLLYDFSIDNFR